ncbi:MAG: very short patch repair endonuclease [Melioribacteraceae bacterium]|nr:very short patch repair endonuclease [Melioribacteraceae bacterium]
MKKRDKNITSKIMSKIPSANTKPEKLLGKELFVLGLRYRKQYKIEGKPDFVFVKKRIAIFVDGDFWHGNNWKIRGLNTLEEELARYSKFWQDKIIRNIRRDKIVNKKLKQQNWLVLRFWESEIKMNCAQIALKILKIYQSR